MGAQRVIKHEDGVVVGFDPPLHRKEITPEQHYNRGYANGKKEALDQLVLAFTFVGVPVVNPLGIGDAVQQATNLLRNERSAPEELPGENLSNARLLAILGDRLDDAEKARQGEAAALQKVAKLKEVLGG